MWREKIVAQAMMIDSRVGRSGLDIMCAIIECRLTDSSATRLLTINMGGW
jgi:hypothetical protein